MFDLYLNKQSKLIYCCLSGEVTAKDIEICMDLVSLNIHGISGWTSIAHMEDNTYVVDKNAHIVLIKYYKIHNHLIKRRIYINYNPIALLLLRIAIKLMNLNFEMHLFKNIQELKNEMAIDLLNLKNFEKLK